MEHTSGPWKRRSIPGHLFEITDLLNNPVIRIRGGMMPTLEDARLLESAPDLLSALEHLEQAYSNKHSPQHRAAAIANARGIIARAKGFT